jgi:hypothetical protein
VNEIETNAKFNSPKTRPCLSSASQQLDSYIWSFENKIRIRILQTQLAELNDFFEKKVIYPRPNEVVQNKQSWLKSVVVFESDPNDDDDVSSCP